MTKRYAAVLFVSLIAACVGQPPDDGGGGGGNGTGGGNGDGTGGGNGSGDGTGSGSGSGGGNTGSITATQFLSQIATKFCDQAFMCQATFPTDAGVTFAEAFGASAQECVSDSAAYDMPTVVEQQITAGKIKFDGVAAAACVAGLMFPACTTFWTDGPSAPAACATAMQGTVADGGACLVDYECTSETSYCEAQKCTPDASGARKLPKLNDPDFAIMGY